MPRGDCPKRHHPHRELQPDYLVFKRAAALQLAGVGFQSLRPSAGPRDPDPVRPNLVSQGIAEVMARVTRMPEPEFIPIRDIEPISFDVAYQLRGFLVTEYLQLVLVVTPGICSQRSSLVYHAVLGPADITVSCVPLFVEKTLKNWTQK